MPQQKPILGYRRYRALGHPIRFLLHYLEVDFEEKLYDEHKPEEWLAEKENLGLLFPNLPYLLDGESKVTEGRAIMKHLCRTRKPELLGKTPEVQTRIDMLDYYMYDILELGLAPVVFQYTDELRKKWAEVDEPKKLRYLDDFIKDNKWATGNDITYIDFFTYEIMYQMTVYNPKCLDNFPKLKEYMRRVEELLAIQKFMNSDTFIKSPCYGIHAIYKM